MRLTRRIPESNILRFDLKREGGGSKGTHTYVVQTIPTFALRGGDFVLWAHLENVNIACKVLEGFTCKPRL